MTTNEGLEAVRVGTGAGEANDPATTEATFGVTRSVDCPEAPAQAHPHTDYFPTCGHTSVRRKHGQRAEQVACALPRGHHGPCRATTDDGVDYHFGPHHDHEGNAA